MINNISWQGYWLTMALLTGIYYGIVFILYYRKEINRLVAGRLRPPEEMCSVHSRQAFTGEDGQAYQYSTEDFSKVSEEKGIESFAGVQSLVDEVQAYFESAKGTNCNKSELIAALRNLVRKHPTVGTTEFKDPVNNIIVFSAEQNCSIHLSAEEVQGVWL